MGGDLSEIDMNQWKTIRFHVGVDTAAMPPLYKNRSYNVETADGRRWM
jgi:hypothetical protein